MKIDNLKAAVPASYIILYIFWTAVELLLYPSMGEGIAPVIITDMLLKNLFWTLPAFLLIGAFDDRMYLKRRELFTNPVNPLAVAGILAAMAAVLLANNMVTHHRFGVTLHFDLTEQLAFVFVGVTEELMFRGWLLNATYSEKHPYLSVGVNALLFLVIHFPYWIRTGVFASAFMGGGFLTILVLSLFFSWNMLHFKNIWVPIILHMVYDILVTMLY